SSLALRPLSPTLFPYTTLFRSVQTGADSGGADVQLAQLLRRGCHIFGAAIDAGRITAELLTERNRHRVLKMRSTRFDDRREFARSEEHTSELQSRSDLVCRLLL